MAFQLQRIDYKSLNQYRLKTYDCGYADFGSNWNSNVVNPSFARLYYILESDGWYETSESRFPLQAGYCYLLPSLFSFRCGCTPISLKHSPDCLKPVTSHFRPESILPA